MERGAYFLYDTESRFGVSLRRTAMTVMKKERATTMHNQRSSGVLLHLTSLPGPFGIGTLGKSAFEFIDFLRAAGQTNWQILPYGPVSSIFDNSPYMSLSAFAGNPLLIDPAQLVGAGLLRREQVEISHDFSEYLVDFAAVLAFKEKILELAFLEFRLAGDAAAFADFCQTMDWLDDYALFMALREEFEGAPWFSWPADIARRKPEALAQWRKNLAERILFHKFVQFCFFSQWQIFWDYAHSHGVKIIGDIPIYVALDSADVWANQECFVLDRETGQPTHVAGVPPDYFSDTGQRWGNPLFKWHGDGGELNTFLLDWWGQRFCHICHRPKVYLRRLLRRYLRKRRSCPFIIRASLIFRSLSLIRMISPLILEITSMVSRRMPAVFWSTLILMIILIGLINRTSCI